MNTAMKTQTGIIAFDLDGTLVDSVPDLAASLDILMARHGLPAIGIANARRLIGHGIGNLVRQAFELHNVPWTKDLAVHVVDEFIGIYSDRLTNETTIYPDVEAVLDELAGGGWAMAVCTNKSEPFARRVLDNLGLLDRFPVVAGPETFGVIKPDPQHLLRTFEAVGGSGPRLFVGDSEVDIATAKVASTPFIALRHGYAKAPLESLTPDAICEGFSGIPSAVRRLAGFSSPVG